MCTTPDCGSKRHRLSFKTRSPAIVVCLETIPTAIGLPSGPDGTLDREELHQPGQGGQEWEAPFQMCKPAALGTLLCFDVGGAWC